jgi:hypothetical protein
VIFRLIAVSWCIAVAAPAWADRPAELFPLAGVQEFAVRGVRAYEDVSPIPPRQHAERMSRGIVNGPLAVERWAQRPGPSGMLSRRTIVPTAPIDSPFRPFLVTRHEIGDDDFTFSLHQQVEEAMVGEFVARRDASLRNETTLLTLLLGRRLGGDDSLDLSADWGNPRREADGARIVLTFERDREAPSRHPAIRTTHVVRFVLVERRLDEIEIVEATAHAKGRRERLVQTVRFEDWRPVPKGDAQVLLPHAVVRTHWEVDPAREPVVRRATLQDPLSDEEIAAMNAPLPRDAYRVGFRETLRQLEYRFATTDADWQVEHLTPQTPINGRPPPELRKRIEPPAP